MDEFNWKYTVMIILITLSLMTVGILGLTFAAYLINVNLKEANIIQIYKDDELIFEGKQAFVSIDSGGMTTTVTIYKKLFPIPMKDKTYSDPNIKIKAK